MIADLRAQLAGLADRDPNSCAADLLDGLDHLDTSRAPQQHCPSCGDTLDGGLMLLGSGELVCEVCAELAWTARYGDPT